ncbi:MAG: cysteine desulfurase family protein [Alphaproteobacteria bacterium]
MNHCYLDHNATTPLRSAVWKKISSLVDVPLNPSSMHYHGQVAQKYISSARTLIKKLCGCHEVIFCGGGSEANNLALHLLLCDLSEKYQTACQLIYFSGEHPSIKNFAKRLDKKFPPALAMPLLANGVADIEKLATTLSHLGDAPKLIALQLANHESGVLQPIEKLVALASQHNGFVFADGVQFFAHRQINMASLGITAATIAGHKLGGWHGAAGVLLMTAPSVYPLYQGGGQENGYRPGTQNTLAIASMGFALEEAIDKQDGENKKYKLWRDKLERQVKNIRPEVLIAGEDVERLDHVSLLVDKSISGQEMVVLMDNMKGHSAVSVSSGAACSSGKPSPSETLAAMGFDDAMCKNTLRVSFGHSNQDSDVDIFLANYKKIMASDN